MPLPAGIGAAAAFKGLDIAGQLPMKALNIGVEHFRHKRDLKAQKELWNMANQYNHPAQQVQRMQEAGLNPALMYGNMASTGNATTPNSPNSNMGSQIPTTSTAQNIGTYHTTKLQAAQRNNLQALTNHEKIKSLVSLLQVDEKQLDNQFTRETWQDAVQGVKANLEKTIAEGENIKEKTNYLKTQNLYLTDKNIREASLNAASIQEIHSRINRMAVQNLRDQIRNTRDRAEVKKLGSQIKNLESSTHLNQVNTMLRGLEYELERVGISKNSPLWAKIGASVGRTLANLMSSGHSIDQAYEELTKEKLGGQNYTAEEMKKIDSLLNNLQK